MGFFEEVIDIGKDKLKIGTPEDLVNTISKGVKSIINKDSGAGVPTAQVVSTAQAATPTAEELVFGMPRTTALLIGAGIAVVVLYWAVKK